MQKRVALVSAAVAVLGLAAAVLGFVAESTKSKAFVGLDGGRCVYQRTPALACGVAAALLALAGLALATAASGCLGRGAPASGGRSRAVAVKLSTVAWVVGAIAVVIFLYGAAMNRGGTRGLSPGRRGGRYGRGYGYGYGCAVLRNGVFAAASVMSAVATECAVAAYVNFQRAFDEPAAAPGPPGQFVAPGVAMGQPQWAQPYPPQPYPPPMGYPAPPPPQYGGYGYGAKQPAGTS